MRKIVKEDQPFVRAELSYDDALAVFADQPYKREIIEKVRAGEAADEDAGEAGGDGGGVSVYRNTVQGDSRFVDLCRGPARPVDEEVGCVQAHEGGRRVLARQREGPDAATHLRHRVGVEGRARRAPASPRGGREARPPQARRGARPLLVPRGDRLRPRGLPPEGCARAPHHGGVLAPAARAVGLRVRELAAHHQGGPVRDVGPPRLVRRRHVPAHAPRRGRSSRARAPPTTSSR